MPFFQEHGLTLAELVSSVMHECQPIQDQVRMYLALGQWEMCVMAKSNRFKVLN